MADTHSKETRSFNMSRIRGKDTKPEMLVRKFLFNAGFRYRLHNKNLPGKPDLIFARYKTVIFVHGCFWHSHKNCRYAVQPKSNREYWDGKLLRNIQRDEGNELELRKLGWKVLVVWECTLKNEIYADTMKLLIETLIS